MSKYRADVELCQQDELYPLVAEGYKVLPIRFRSKRPRTKHGVKDATNDWLQVSDWLAFWPEDNWAVACGGAKRLLTIDVDGPHGHKCDGRPAWESMSVDTSGPWHKTPSGWRFWFQAPAGVTLRNGKGRIGPGIDHQWEGGYAIVPPSLLKTGVYRWQVAPWQAPLPTVPDVILERLSAPTVPTAATVAADIALPASMDLAELAQRVAAAQRGTRNETLNRVAYRVGRMIAAGHVDRAAAELVLTEAGRAAGLGKFEITATVTSGLEAGLRAGPWSGPASAEAARTAGAVRSWALSSPWPGAKALTDRAVLLAHCDLSARAGKSPYTADVRTVAEVGHVPRSTVSDAQKRLVAAGCLERVAKADKSLGNAATWRLVPVNCAKFGHTSKLPMERSETVSVSVEEHEEESAGAAALWARGEFGPVAGEVYRLLGRGPATVPALTTATGQARRTVQRALSILAAHDLAVRVGRAWTRGPSDPEVVAETTGATARAGLRAGRHEREREEWRSQR